MTKARPIVSADTMLAIQAPAEAPSFLNCNGNRNKLLKKGGKYVSWPTTIWQNSTVHDRFIERRQ